ncbi:hypothetical protein GIY23_05880 [Allosaccharopolyspora coralli]|uniref:Uncharacterized protein n=1 Tax=Allosaccharopolyspora coralli TaxID=2665642 RepID=A0A5Q3QEA4_9PSEU|nr:hypothetical protein [Allosaccharopolyspora coralli]QGK69127.1 hypothetical protein GIY23_05880 [Allosaccharopolyspora coralli]
MSWPQDSEPTRYEPPRRRESSAKPWIVLACVMAVLALAMGAISAVVLMGRSLPSLTVAGSSVRPPGGPALSADWAAQPHPSLPCGEGTPPEVVRTDQGDLTGDGYPEVLVTMTCRAVTTAQPEVVEVYDGASPDGEPRLLSTFFESDRISVADVSVNGRVVSIDGDAWSDSAPNCCPDQTFVQEYSWTGSGFSAAPRTVTPVTSSAAPAPQTQVAEPTYPSPSSGCPSSAPYLVSGMQTAQSQVLLCTDSSGQVYYSGTDLGSGNAITLPAYATGRGYEAYNDGYTYLVTGSALIVKDGGSVMSEQPVLSSW